jgi:hypothetical protein
VRPDRGVPVFIAQSVSNYSLRIKQKLGAASIADLVRLAIAEGLCLRNTLADGSSGQPGSNPIPA